MSGVPLGDTEDCAQVSSQLPPIDRASDRAAAAGWYLCFSKPRQEALAEAKLREQGFETFLPRLAIWQRKAGRWQQHAEVLFPRYLFVRPSHAQQAIGPVRSTPGVTQLVRFGPTLAMMAAPRVRALQALCQQMTRALPQHALAPGAHVVFASGPLKGATGIVSAVAQERVNVLLSLLGHEHAVWAHADDLAAA